MDFGESVQCSVVVRGIRCKHRFPLTFRNFKGEQIAIKTCPSHRAAKAKYEKTDKGKECKKRKGNTVWMKECRRTYSKSDKGKAARARFQESDKGKESKALKYQLDMQDPGLRLMHRMSSKMNKMIRKEKDASYTVKEVSGIASSNELCAHFELQFSTSGMNWENYGFGDDMWNIGHRIAKCMFDASNMEDMRRCWSKANLFPQWQTENFRLKERLPDDLQALQNIWPVGWNDVLPTIEQRRLLEKIARGDA